MFLTVDQVTKLIFELLTVFLVLYVLKNLLKVLLVRLGGHLPETRCLKLIVLLELGAWGPGIILPSPLEHL